MHKVLKLILIIFFNSLAISMHAQNKYAVLIAVNDYYENPGVKHSSSLQGCVNDANAIKGLLLNRFGFTANNIATLYNEKVTKKNFIDLMHAMLRKCKPGDALVFYYSGHGVWMDNDMNDSDSIKAGMSQAIVMSDLYAPGWDCLVRDETLKQIFNQFVDKKIIVTTILDCCYSANLMMMPDPQGYWKPLPRPAATKTIFLRNIPFIAVTEKPTGCTVDSSGKIMDTLDTDHDGIPDCKDWEIHTPPLSAVDSEGVNIETISEQEFLASPDNYYDSASFARSVLSDDEPENVLTDTRSFNLRDNLTIRERATQARPSERPNSNFLSLAGTSDRNKGLEITDETGMKHGAFTKALISAYKKNSADLPVFQLQDTLTAYMLGQRYYQSPTYYSEPGRLKGNLIGISSFGFSKTVKAVCTDNKSGIVTLDKGRDAGIAKGNIFTAVTKGKYKVQVSDVQSETASAIDKSGGRIKKGDILELTDSYTISAAPLVKIYIPSAGFTPASFTSFFNKTVTKWVRQKSYRDYHFWSSDKTSTMIFLDDSVKSYKIANSTHLPGAEETLFYVFLPVPSYITTALKALLMKDQNIEIVSDRNKADYVLYLNYTKERPDHKSGFVFYFHPSLTKEEQQDDPRVFSLDHAEVPSVTTTGKPLQVLSQKVYELAKKTIRYKTSAWMNTYEKR
jgi:hypothetical protein